MKKKELELGVGDLVVYPTYGVGEIENFDTYDVDGSMQDFILINFKQDKMNLAIAGKLQADAVKLMQRLEYK